MGQHSNKVLAGRIAALPPPRHTWPRWIVTGGGLGLLRPAPGSWGSALPAMVYWLLLTAHVPDPLRSEICLAGAVAAGIVLVLLGRWACAYFHQPDPGQVVLDEFTGFWIACAFLPIPANFTRTWWGSWLVAAGVYVLFRLTDTLKLPPCRQLENLPWGWGILLDDIAAGMQANLLLQLLLWMPWR